MPRKLRLQYPGAIYHLMNRGDRRETIFADDADRHRFVKTLAETCQRTGWQVHAYCLMSNHFHLIVETPQPNLVAGMKWLLGTYTIRFNRRHKEFGHVFSGRYKSLIVDGSGNGYLKSVCDYVHLNPVRARLLQTKEPLESYVWSSYGQYLKAPGKRISWLRVDRLWASGESPRTVWPAANALPNAWNIAAARKVPSPTGKPSSGAGSWAARSSSRNCWPRCTSVEGITMGPNYARPIRCTPSAY
jgi:REP element-mobilizing transposase RayT